MQGLEIFLIAFGGAFALLGLIAIVYKPFSVYCLHAEQRNPFEGKRVRLVEDPEDEPNADGLRGHLEAVGPAEPSRRIYSFFKRLLDIVLSFLLLIVLSSLFLVILIALEIDNPGPVFFTQKRVGKNKRFFKLHKFRSMRRDTPHDVPTHMLDHPERYITRVGKFLRAHSLDELPQIWDIFLGNMSFVGPRPALWSQDYLVSERDRYGANDILPGLTGWAQLHGRDELEIPQKAKLDGEYVSRFGFRIDVKCFFGSFRVLKKDESVVEGGTGKRKQPGRGQDPEDNEEDTDNRSE